MPLWKIVAALPPMAVGMLLVRHGLWLSTAEIPGADGTCQGLEELFCYALAFQFFVLSLVILFKRTWTRPNWEGTGCVPPKGLHPSQDTSTLFY